MTALKIKLFALFSFLLLILSFSSVVGQLQYSSVTSNIALSSDGTCTICDDLGVTFNIEGVPGAVGTVTTDIRIANPQPTANIPTGISLTYFLYVTFNIDAADFTKAEITIPYTDSQVQGLQTPYSIFKYNPATDSYSELAAVADANAKTFTVTVTSIEDPLFAIGGVSVTPSSTPVSVTPSATPDNGGFLSVGWVALTASVVIIVLLAVAGVWYFKKK